MYCSLLSFIFFVMDFYYDFSYQCVHSQETFDAIDRVNYSQILVSLTAVAVAVVVVEQPTAPAV